MYGKTLKGDITWDQFRHYDNCCT